MNRLGKNSVIVISILTLLYVLPLLYEVAFKPLPDAVLISYSTYKDEFLINKKDGPKSEYYTAGGQQISKETYYEWLPVFYYKKLEKDGSLPDSINNEPLTIGNLKRHNYFFRLTDGIVNEAQPVFVPIFEATDEATHFNINNDFFSFKHQIEFIDIYTGEKDEEKSQKFTEALETSGFVFPAKKIYGDIRPQKNFDSGYYIIDAHNHLFTLRMVLGKPVVEIIPIPNNLSVCYIFCTDPLNMEILSVIISKQNEIYLHLGTTNIIVKTDITNYNPEKDEILIFGNQFNKTFLFQNDREIRLNVINDNYKTFRSYQYNRQPKKFKLFDTFKNILFPVRIKIDFKKNQIVKPTIEITDNYFFFLINLLPAIFYFLYRRKNKPFIETGIIFLTGIPGLISFLMIRNE